MKIKDIVSTLNANVLFGDEFLNDDAETACGSDLMSDVLAFVKDKTVLLTGLMNPQVVRTAEMLDVVCIVFVRGKQPAEDVLNMAKSRDIAVLSTRETLFTACGMLYEKGLRGTTPHEEGAL